ncbi:DUF4112 domain-containing protein [Palleronia sp. LCG004]|uniref:DUF4112 domain-containing protein n=1 Tax=Palleronia sp. LCG004 TaxID=3079304 RepID=UPI00294289DB|nr:DUF4112 domain-containing protein [Palleronia sp. LCG004]WOI55195.1 DUF4112 domain-containing protein [Palleronia sp. LCG004]
MEQHPHFHRLERLERLAVKLDSAFRIPGTKIRVGWDPIVSVVPLLGDALALAPGAYILNESRRMGLPRHKLAKQVVNCGIDFAIGSIPVLGTFFDVGFRSNKRNVKILRDHLEGEMKTAPAMGEGRMSSHHPEIGGRRGV